MVPFNKDLEDRANLLIELRQKEKDNKFDSKFNLICMHIPSSGATSNIRAWATNYNYNLIEIIYPCIPFDATDNELKDICKKLYSYIKKEVDKSTHQSVVFIKGFLFFENFINYRKILPLLDELGDEDTKNKIFLIIGEFYPWYLEDEINNRNITKVNDDSSYYNNIDKNSLFFFEPTIDEAYKYIKYILREFIEEITERIKNNSNDSYDKNDLLSYKFNLGLTIYMEKNSKLKLYDFDSYFKKDNSYRIKTNFLSNILTHIYISNNFDPDEYLQSIEEYLKYLSINESVKNEFIRCATEYTSIYKVINN